MANSRPTRSLLSTSLLAAPVLLLAACNGETPKPPASLPEKPPGVAAPTKEKEGPATPGMTSTPTVPPTNPPPAAPAAPAKPADAATPGATSATNSPEGRPRAAAGATALSGKLAATVVYRERMMLPPDAMVKVQLADVSRADAPAVVVSEASMAAKSAPPYVFELTYDPAKIDPRSTYAVSARIEQGGKLMFTSDTRHGVLTRGAPMDAIEVVVKRVEDPQK